MKGLTRLGYSLGEGSLQDWDIALVKGLTRLQILCKNEQGYETDLADPSIRTYDFV